MCKPPNRTARLSVAVVLALYGQAAWSQLDAEDLKVINAADCADLIEEYRDFSAAEQELADSIKAQGTRTVATNVIGVATLATLGFGIFSWDDDSDARASLAELHDIRVAIGAASERKHCNAHRPPEKPTGKPHK